MAVKYSAPVPDSPPGSPVTIRTLSFFGLGKLGFPIAACLSARGVEVLGIDANPALISRLREDKPDFTEPGLQELWPEARKRFRVAADPEEAVIASQATILFVPTPSAPDGRYLLDRITEALRPIGKAIARKADRHLVVIGSTVSPGDCEGPIASALERESGKKLGRDFGLCYGPQFVALGSVVRDFLKPDLRLIGESDPASGAAFEALLRSALGDAPVQRMNLVNAELTKISLNAFVTTKITFANLVARLCERFPGADADVVTAALGRDSRIGPKSLKGALGYGGPCFPRDNQALTAVARRAGIDAQLPTATDADNRARVAWLGRAVRAWIPAGGTVALLGLSYKPGTPVVEESPGMALAIDLAGAGLKVQVSDPMAIEEARKRLGNRVDYRTLVSFDGVDAVVIATPWSEFRDLPWKRLRAGAVVVDCWKMLDRTTLPAGLKYVGLGEALPEKP